MACVSECKGKSKSQCEDDPLCSYVSDKFCRLSSAYKMTPPDCVPTKKSMYADLTASRKKEIAEFKEIFKTPAAKKTPTKKAPKPELTESRKKEIAAFKEIFKNPAAKKTPTKKAPKPELTESRKKEIAAFKKIFKNPQTKKARKIPEGPPLAPVPDAIDQKFAEEVVHKPMDVAEFRKKISSHKIARFIHSNRTRKNLSHLKVVCSDSDVCIAFGTEANKIKQHFEHFNNFALIRQPLRTFGSVSNNGFVKHLVFEKGDYVANAVLKSSVKVTSDNLLYEGMVGMYLNKMGRQFPCFVDTYGIYKYNMNTPAYSEMMKRKLTPPGILTHGLTRLRNIDTAAIAESCANPRTMSVLIQYLKNAKTLKDSLTPEFIHIDLMTTLFQVYLPLSIMKDEYTHYDLHHDNVLLYEPVVGKYIQYNYHFPDGRMIRFKSRYIVKIIDYGRSFFNDDENETITGNSARLYTQLCRSCVRCGEDKGFPFFEKTNLANNYYICSQKKNVSHDLVLLNYMRYFIKHIMYSAQSVNELNRNPVFKQFIEKLHFGNPQSNAFSYGTPEIVRSGLPAAINNVSDASAELENIIHNAMFSAYNDENYSNMDSLGELNVYTDGRPMRFVPAA
jgi:hypothetical protein